MTPLFNRLRAPLLPLIALFATISTAHFTSSALGDEADGSTDSTKLDDPVARLQTRIDRGDLKLNFDTKHGYLESVLKALNIPQQSQGLVFSKTSFQAARISPHTPRAIYFNDDVYIGWVRDGEVLEVASVDPRHGPEFYSLRQEASEHPLFARQTHACLQCHQSQQTGDEPGFLMRSVYPDAGGMPLFAAGSYATTDRSPFAERWGGWYVDGASADAGMANRIAPDAERPDKLSPIAGRMTDAFDSADYLQPHSDAVALAVLAHQTHVHNLMTRAAEQTRKALEEEAAIERAMGEPPGGHSATTEMRVRSACEPLVQAMLFSGEAQWDSPLHGSTDFARRFESLGPRDDRGRSLRAFDLHRRLFRYPCSYLIYSEQFAALPDPARQFVLRRMWQVLTGRDDSAEYRHLSDDDRDAIYHILRGTLPNLPACWK